MPGRSTNLLLLLALSCLCSMLACTSKNAPPRILVFSKTAGYRHASIPTGVAALRQLCQKNGMLMDSTENAEDFNEKNLCRYATVVFLCTTGDVLDPNQEAEFERYIQAGGGFVGVHAASDTEYGWAWYGNLVGGYFESHPDIQEATLNVLDHQHPATKHLGDKWIRKDEWYNFRNLNPQVKVLMKIDESSYQGGKNGKNHPMAWYHEYDGGRAFYTALGHTEESYSEPDFLKHLLGGLKYAIGKNRRPNYKMCRTPELPDPTRFVKTVLAHELSEPMELELFPDGKIIFIERRGAIKLFNPNTGLVNTAYKLPVHDVNEDGLLGLALDPNWKKNHWIYLYYSPAGEKPVNYLSRFVFVADTLDRASEIVLLEVPVQREECCHTGGSIEFDAEGYLYLSTGDNTNPFNSEGYAPTDEQPGRSAWDAQKSSANSMDLRGKILRIKPLPNGSYACPAGNLEGAAPEVYVMGCRNPFRISIDNQRKLLFWGEVGPDAGDADSTRGPAGHDEVNRARSAGFFGWPYFVGNNKAYRDYNFQTKLSGPHYDPEHPVNNSPNNKGAQQLPPAQPALIWYPYGNSEEFPLTGNGGRNAMAGPVYYCDQYPADTRFPDYYNGKLITYDWIRGWMMAVSLDSLGNFSRMEPFAEALSFSRPMDMLIDKNGSIWVLEYGTQWFSTNADARLSRIDYVRGNRPPIPQLAADKTAGSAPCTVLFSASGSKDYDQDRLRYSFDFGDGSPVLALDNKKKIVAQAGLDKTRRNASVPTDSVWHTFKKTGTYTVILTVSDQQGSSTTAQQTIKVGNEPPSVYWDFFEKNRSFYEPGTTLKYALRVNDLEDGSLDKGQIYPELVSSTIDYLETGFDITQIAQGHQAAQQQSNYGRGKMLMDRSDCSSCHAPDKQVNGPAYQAIAQRYRKNEFAVRDLSKKIIKGGTGNWGQTAMSAHPQLSESEAGEMVRWILALDAPLKPKQHMALAGEYSLAVPQKKKAAPGTFLFYTSYQDRGSPSQAPLQRSETLALRPTFQQAELADSTSKRVRNYRPKGHEAVVLNELMHNSFFMLKRCDLWGIYSVAIGLGPADPNYPVEGGRIELRLNSPGGELLGSVNIPASHDSHFVGISDHTIPVRQAAWPTDRSFCDLYFVLKNENNPSRPIATVDWLHFNL